MNTSVTEWVVIAIVLWKEVSVSNLSWGTGYLDRDFVVFLSTFR
jgi:hypothetical protein